MESESSGRVMESGEPWALRVEQAAELLRVSRSHLYALVSRGELPSVRVGGCRRILAADLREWLEAQKR